MKLIIINYSENSNFILIDVLELGGSHFLPLIVALPLVFLVFRPTASHSLVIVEWRELLLIIHRSGFLSGDIVVGVVYVAQFGLISGREQGHVQLLLDFARDVDLFLALLMDYVLIQVTVRIFHIRVLLQRLLIQIFHGYGLPGLLEIFVMHAARFLLVVHHGRVCAAHTVRGLIGFAVLLFEQLTGKVLTQQSGQDADGSVLDLAVGHDSVHVIE